jgi:hypothetical protein
MARSFLEVGATTGYAVGGRWVFAVEEPLLAGYDGRTPFEGASPLP